jgi:hypothetical protein
MAEPRTVPREVLRFLGVGVHSLGTQIAPEQLEELCAWVASLGADPKRILPQFRILACDGRFQVHLSQKVQRDGHDVLDQALDKVWSEPLVIDLGTERSWPKWLYDTDERS